jgi:hypothetical protein
MEEKEKGICEVEKVSNYGPNTVGIVKFKQKYNSPPHIQLTASQEGRPSDWAGLLCSIFELTETYLIIDFDGWRIIDGIPTFQQEVYPGAKCYWTIV